MVIAYLMRRCHYDFFILKDKVSDIYCSEMYVDSFKPNEECSFFLSCIKGIYDKIHYKEHYS